MKHLKPSERSELYKKLTDEQSDLIKQLDQNGHFQLSEALSDSIGELSAYDNHPADLGTEMYERGKDIALNEHAEHQLADIETALALFDKKEYGLCAVCGKPIPFERLQAVPTTAYCIEHARDRFVSDRRPVEEEILAPPFGRTSQDELPEQNQFDGEDAWQIVAGWGTSNSPAMSENRDVDDYDDLEIEHNENDGYVEDFENFLATDIYGNNVTVIRNAAYYNYFRSGEGDPLLEPESQDSAT